MHQIKIGIAVLLTIFLLTACGKTPTAPQMIVHETLIKVPDQAIAAYIIEPRNGAVVSSPFHVLFGLKGMGITPAGSNIENTGHHHLLIDMDELPDMTMPLPASEQLLHFGKGQTQTLLNLDKGVHSLQLVLGDFTHTPHSTPVLSERILITVK